MAETSSPASLFQSLPDSFSSQTKVRTVCVECEARAAEKRRLAESVLPIHECDLSSVMLTLTRTGVPTRFLIFSDQDKVKGEMRIDALVHPKHEIKGTNPLDTTQLSLAVSPYASCSPAKHAMVTLTPSGGDDVECKSVSGVLTKYDTTLYRPLRRWEGDLASGGDTFQFWQLIQWCWGAISDDHMGRVDVDVATCGIRKAGKIVGGAKLAIHLYPIESYSLALSLPPLWSRKRLESKQLRREQNNPPYKPIDVAIDKQKSHTTTLAAQEDKFLFSPKSAVSRSTTTQDAQIFGADVSLEKRSRTLTQGRTTVTGDTYYVDGQKGTRVMEDKWDGVQLWEQLGIKLALKRNGSNLDFEVGKFLTTVTKLSEALDLFRKGMTTAIKGEASLGLTMSGELNFLVVDLTATWQRKEDGAQAIIPWNVTVALTGKLIDASLSAKYGLAVKYTCWGTDVVNAELSVTVTFAGNAPVSLSYSATVWDDGKDWRWNAKEVPVKANLSVAVSGVGTAMVMGQGVEAKASAVAGLALDSKFDPGGPAVFASLKGDITFTGIMVTVSTIRFGKVRQSKPIPLVDPAVLFPNFMVGRTRTD